MALKSPPVFAPTHVSAYFMPVERSMIVVYSGLSAKR